MNTIIKVYPMGAAANERMTLRKQTAFHSHAFNVSTGKLLCSVKASSLCWDDSLCEPAPSCPVCARKLARLTRAGLQVVIFEYQHNSV